MGQQIMGRFPNFVTQPDLSGSGQRASFWDFEPRQICMSRGEDSLVQCHQSCSWLTSNCLCISRQCYFKQAKCMNIYLTLRCLFWIVQIKINSVLSTCKVHWSVVQLQSVVKAILHPVQTAVQCRPECLLDYSCVCQHSRYFSQGTIFF